METFDILSIIMFGSSARGESDDYSDVDVCVITRNHHSRSRLAIIKDYLSNKYSFKNADIIIYSAEQIENMYRYGSLFLWHLKLEGKTLYDDSYFSELCDKLAKYDKHLSELNYHYELLKDVESSIENLCIVNEMDLGQLFTICRNTCMILAHFNNQFAFGRKSAFSAANQIYFDLPLTEEEYIYLSRWKLRYERGLFDELALPSLEKVNHFIKQTKTLIYFAIEKVAND